MEEPLNPTRPQRVDAEQEPAATGAAAALLTPDETAPSPRRSLWMTTLRCGGLTVVCGALALLIWGTLAAGRGENLVQQIAKGRKPLAPSFTLAVLWPHTETWPNDATGALGDGTLSLVELRGHPIVLNFWASWCVACKAEAPLLHATAQAHAGKVIFLGLDIQDLSDEARNFARKYRMNYVSVRDRTDGAYRAYGLTGVPETYYIDARGHIVAHSPGEVTREDLERGIAAATAAAR